jgi:hypothetical protein
VARVLPSRLGSRRLALLCRCTPAGDDCAAGDMSSLTDQTPPHFPTSQLGPLAKALSRPAPELFEEAPVITVVTPASPPKAPAQPIGAASGTDYGCGRCSRKKAWVAAIACAIGVLGSILIALAITGNLRSSTGRGSSGTWNEHIGGGSSSSSGGGSSSDTGGSSLSGGAPSPPPSVASLTPTQLSDICTQELTTDFVPQASVRSLKPVACQCQHLQ